jgi:DMSO/TMAO reductase YedYZ molybdopterin-dependent catalytic subunit
MAISDTPIVDAPTWRRMRRREVLKLAPLSLLAALLAPDTRQAILRGGLAASGRAGAWLFRPSQLAPTFSESELTPLERFPVNSYSTFEPSAAELSKWRLYVDGLVARPGAYTFDQIVALPSVVQNVRHICIEGWDVIGSFGGARLSDLLMLVGADPTARFVEVGCLDDYYSSMDMASALHPQTLACYEMYGKPLTAGHGAPLRLHSPVKLGYKSAKHVYSLRVSNVLRAEKGFWEDQGYSWYGGI